MYDARAIIDTLDSIELAWSKPGNRMIPYTSDYDEYMKFYYSTPTRTVDDLWNEAVSYGIRNEHPTKRWDRCTRSVLYRGE